MEENKNEEIIEQKEPEDPVDGENSSDKKRAGMTGGKGGLYLRTAIGAMILYYAYTIWSDITSTPASQRAPLYVFIAVFVIAGIWIVIDSVRRLIKKEYEK